MKVPQKSSVQNSHLSLRESHLLLHKLIIITLLCAKWRHVLFLCVWDGFYWSVTDFLLGLHFLYIIAQACLLPNNPFSACFQIAQSYSLFPNSPLSLLTQTESQLNTRSKTTKKTQLRLNTAQLECRRHLIIKYKHSLIIRWSPHAG